EGGAFPEDTLDGDLSAHHLREAPANREPESRAAIFPRGRRVDLREVLEQAARLLRGHPDPGVADPEANPFAAVVRLAQCVEPNGPTLGELAGVAQEVEQDLPQPGQVAPDHAEVWRVIRLQRVAV